MRTLIIDNYDSFTFNLFQYVAELGGNPVVYKNDELTVGKIKKLKPTHIILSPGPGNPTRKKDFGVCDEVIGVFGSRIPILGVCLGHQGIVAHFGGKIVHAPEVMHGKRSRVEILKKGETAFSSIFKNIPKEFDAMRYHSLVADQKTLPEPLAITARTVDGGVIMAVAHKKFPLYGIQFHPESFGTKVGKTIIGNFLKLSPARRSGGDGLKRTRRSK